MLYSSVVGILPAEPSAAQAAGASGLGVAWSGARGGRTADWGAVRLSVADALLAVAGAAAVMSPLNAVVAGLGVTAGLPGL